MSDRRNVFEVLEYGPIVASNDDHGLLVTANGSYLNLWVGDSETGFINTDVRHVNAENGLYGLKITDVMERAEAYLAEVINGFEEE